MTTSQELGWFTFEGLGVARPQTEAVGNRWNHSLNSTAITQFAADYEKLRGINPFKIKERMKVDLGLDKVTGQTTAAADAANKVKASAAGRAKTKSPAKVKA